MSQVWISLCHAVDCHKKQTSQPNGLVDTTAQKGASSLAVRAYQMTTQETFARRTDIADEEVRTGQHAGELASLMYKPTPPEVTASINIYTDPQDGLSRQGSWPALAVPVGSILIRLPILILAAPSALRPGLLCHSAQQTHIGTDVRTHAYALLA